MRPETATAVTTVIRPGIVPVPLAVQTIGHVHDVVDGRRDIRDREALEVPVGGGSCDRERLIRGEFTPNFLQESKVASTIIWIASGNSRDIRGAGVLPVKIQSIEAIIISEFRDVRREQRTLFIRDTLSKDGVGVQGRGKRPPTKGQNLWVFARR